MARVRFRAVKSIFSFGITEFKTDLDHISPIIALMTEAVSTIETSMNFHQCTRSNIPQNCHLMFS
jgi:hypothetical protein